MSVLRFLMHTVLACWVAVTAVLVATALQWFTARATAEVKVQRALNAQKEANDNTVSDSWQDQGDTPQQREATAQMRRNYSRSVLKSESTNEEMSEVIYLERIERKHFWMQIALWAGLTLLGSALLAECWPKGNRGDERAQAFQRVSVLPKKHPEISGNIEEISRQTGDTGNTGAKTG